MGEGEKEVLGRKHFPGITTMILQAAQRLRTYTVNLQMLTQCHTKFSVQLNVYLEIPG